MKYSLNLFVSFFFRNITLVLKNTNEFFATDADIHLDSSTYLPINSSILYEGYILGKIINKFIIIYSIKILLDHPESSHVTGGFYSNWFDGIIKYSNETWHIEPTRKYGIDLINTGPSIIYNALDIDLTRYKMNETIRSKRDVFNEDLSSSFCGLDDKKNREEMDKESERLIDDDEDDFKYRYTRPKRDIKNSTERTCCYVYLRVDPTLWDVVYQNEGLNVREKLFIIRSSDHTVQQNSH